MPIFKKYNTKLLTSGPLSTRYWVLWFRERWEIL